MGRGAVTMGWCGPEYKRHLFYLDKPLFSQESVEVGEVT